LRSALLQPSEPVIGLLTLQRALARSVLPPAVQRDAERSFSPHVTLFYGGPTGSTVPIDPISWTAEELVLIHSVHGKGVHNDLARWPLTR
jgi:2'-5' RNA ligase